MDSGEIANQLIRELDAFIAANPHLDRKAAAKKFLREASVKDLKIIADDPKKLLEGTDLFLRGQPNG